MDHSRNSFNFKKTKTFLWPAKLKLVLFSPNKWQVRIGVVWTGRSCYSVTQTHTLLHCVTLWHSPKHWAAVVRVWLHCVVLHCVLREVGRTQSVISCKHRGAPLSTQWNLVPVEKVQTRANWSKSPVLLFPLDDSVVLLSSGWLCCAEKDKDSRLRERPTPYLCSPIPFYFF